MFLLHQLQETLFWYQDYTKNQEKKMKMKKHVLHILWWFPNKKEEQSGIKESSLEFIKILLA